MTNDSVAQVVKYQRNVKSLPPGVGFSIRTYWAGPLSSLGGSVRNYVKNYKGITTYLPLVGLQDVTELVVGVMPDLLNGIHADDPSQSASWNAIMNTILNGFNTVQGTGYEVSMQSFTISSPASASNVTNVFDLIGVAAQLLEEALRTNSVTVSGQFQLDIQTGGISIIPPRIPPPDPRPVFDWSLIISWDSNAHSITLEIDIAFDHMENNNLLDWLIVVFLTWISAGYLTYLAGSILFVGAGEFVVGQILTQDYNAAASSKLQDALAKALSQLPAISDQPPIQFALTAKSNKEFVLSVTYTVDSTGRNGLVKYINDPSSVVPSAKELGIIS
jgi:hypothetical protein